MRSLRGFHVLRSLGSGVVGGILVLVLIGGHLHPVHAQSEKYIAGGRAVSVQPFGEDWKDCGLRKGDVNAFTSVRPKASAKRSPTATIEVDYSGFPSEARRAFERAVEVWERHIKSEVTIRIDASYEPLDPGVLGGTRPNFVYGVNTDQDNQIDVAVFDALADAISGKDQQSGSADFSIALNSDRNDWHFGEGDAPAGTIDFTSVVLHEIAHGLGYFAGTRISNGEGQYGINFQNVAEPVPLVYTTFLAEQNAEDRVFLTNESEFPNPSSALAEAFTSDRLVFDGQNANVTAGLSSGPVPPKIYAPSSFSRGSSISHLDEFAYSTGGTNALMTPIIRAAETNRLPGPVVCGQLHDMFWPLGEGCRRYLADVFALQFANSPNPSEGSVTLTWKVRDDANIQEFIVERKYFDGAFEPVKRIQAPPVTLDSLGLGKHTFRIRWVRSDGSEETTVRSVETTFRPRNIASEIVSRDEQRRAAVSLSWKVPPGSEGFTYRVERQTGDKGSFKEIASAAQTSRTVRRQTPGTYRYRILAEDKSGNVVVGEEKEVVKIDFEGAVYVLGPYPNPVRETASFDLTARDVQPVTVEVYNTTGERLYREERFLEANVPEFLSIDVGQWGSGMYFLRVRGQEFVKTRKMIVVR